MKYKTSYNKVIILFVIIMTVLVSVYYYNFKGQGMSKFSTEWANFSTYLNGITSPILSLISILVLLKVNESVKNSYNIKNKLTKLSNKYKMKDFTMKVPTNATFSDCITKMNELIENLEFHIDSIIGNQDELKKNILTICEEKGGNLTNIEKTFLDNDGFESKCLGYPNSMAHIKLYLILIQIAHYHELQKKDTTESYKVILNDLNNKLEDCIKSNLLAD